MTSNSNQKKQHTHTLTNRQTDRHAGVWVGRNHKQSMDHNGNALQPYVGGPNDVLLIANTADALLESPDSLRLVSYRCCSSVCVCVYVRVCLCMVFFSLCKEKKEEKICQREKEREREREREREDI